VDIAVAVPGLAIPTNLAPPGYKRLQIARYVAEWAILMPLVRLRKD
jgi:hypothetical protein